MKKQNLYILLGLVVIGIIFRIFDCSRYSFGFDQIQILENAARIKDGNLTLIGPRTGPAEMFTGPLIYYLTAILLFFVRAPYTIVASSLLISLVTGLSIFFLSKKYLSINRALVILSLWAASPLLIYFDRVTWNPNFSLLASSLVFFPLLSLIEKKGKNQFNDFLIMLGCFLGFQAHFSGLFLLLFVFILFPIYKASNFKTLIFASVGLCISLFPTFLFDYRHNWLNTRGLYNFLYNSEGSANVFHINKILLSFRAMVVLVGKIFTFHLPSQTNMAVGLSFFIMAIMLLLTRSKLASKGIKARVRFSLIWIIITSLLISFYSGEAPEYYYFIALPAVLILISEILIMFFSFLSRYLRFILFSLYIFYISLNLQLIINRGHLQLRNVSNITEDIISYSQTNAVSEVEYDFKPAIDHIGIEFLLQDKVKTDEKGDIIHIVKNQNYSDRYGEFQIWIDSRHNDKATYITFEDLLLRIMSPIELLEDHVVSSKFNNFQSFRVINNNVITNDFLILVRTIEDPFNENKIVYSDLKNQVVDSESDRKWKTINYLQYTGYLCEFTDYLLMYQTDLEYNQVESILEKIDSANIKPGLLR